MEYITSVIDPAELTGYVREVVDGDLPFESLFPTVQTDDIEYELSIVDVTGAGEVARYRSWDTPAPIGRRPGLSVIRGEIPPLSWGYRLNEKDLKRFKEFVESNGATGGWRGDVDSGPQAGSSF